MKIKNFANKSVHIKKKLLTGNGYQVTLFYKMSME